LLNEALEKLSAEVPEGVQAAIDARFSRVEEESPTRRAWLWRSTRRAGSCRGGKESICLQA